MKSIVFLSSLLLFTVGCGGASSSQEAGNPCQPGPEAEAENPCQPAETANETDGAPEANAEPCPPDDEVCRVERLGDESLGWIELGLSEQEVVEKLGVPESQGEVFEEGATGLFISTFEWPSKGIEMDMAATTEDGERTVNSATISAPSDLKTSRGIGIGSSEADVKTAYDGLADPDHTRNGELFVAGSVYGGVFFNFQDGLVTNIFMGAGAE